MIETAMICFIETPLSISLPARSLRGERVRGNCEMISLLPCFQRCWTFSMEKSETRHLVSYSWLRIYGNRSEAAIALETVTFAAPDDVAAGECANPQGELQHVLDRREPPAAVLSGNRAETFLQVVRGDDADEQRARKKEEGPFRRLRDEPERGPEHGVAEDARGVGQGFAGADGARPAELMRPDLAPVHRRRQAIHDDGTKGDALAGDSHDAVAELKIIGEIICERFEAADFFKLRAAGDHDGAESEVERLEACALQDLTPEIGVDGDGLPMHRERRGIGEAIKTIHEPDFGIAQRSRDVQQKIGGHEDVGVADDGDVVFGAALQLDEAGDLAIDAQRLRAQDELGIGAGVFLEQLADDGAGRVVRGRHAEEYLGRRGVILGNPASQATEYVVIQALKRFEDGYGRGEGFIGYPAMERKAPCCNPLPYSDYHADNGESLQNNEHTQFLDGAGRLGKRQLLRNWPKSGKFALTAMEGIDYKTLESTTLDRGQATISFSNHLWQKDFDAP